ncbi:MAG TPA: hypothetical protein VMC62_05295 [Longilinea sp.]|nr:hypothetical protein [Longilinea sp.]
MASVEVKKTFEGKSASDLYDAGLKALPKAGFAIWKERQLAYLVMSKRMENGSQIDCNYMAHMGSPVGVSVTLGCDSLTEDDLRLWADKVFAAVQEVL